MLRVSINGFGRIGRQAFKVILDRFANEIDVVAINDLSEPKILAHLFKYDSVYGVSSREVSSDEQNLIVDAKKYPIIAEKDPSQLPWKNMNVDVVIECTGRFTKADLAQNHLKAGAKRVVISAPSEDVPTHVLGVNKYDGKAQIINNGSCTTNCVGPVTAVIHSRFKILKAWMTTIHSMTAEQNIVDGPPPALHPDLRRARAGSVNIVPTSTGAAKAIAKAMPEVTGKFDGMAFRVPTIDGSVADFTFIIEKKTTVEEVNKSFLEASKNPIYKGILAISEQQIVSTDIIGRSESAIVDLPLTKVVDGDLVKVIAWYDNEWGYANRLVEQVLEVGKSLK